MKAQCIRAISPQCLLCKLDHRNQDWNPWQPLKELLSAICNMQKQKKCTVTKILLSNLIWLDTWNEKQDRGREKKESNSNLKKPKQIMSLPVQQVQKNVPLNTYVSLYNKMNFILIRVCSAILDPVHSFYGRDIMGMMMMTTSWLLQP